ncbi:MAG: hypothetical protein H6622_09735 [Halobacteriovoraceae bacterium]|nr:hypothetical protein [Halobacteriovoraceae bacterium]
MKIVIALLIFCLNSAFALTSIKIDSHKGEQLQIQTEFGVSINQLSVQEVSSSKRDKTTMSLINLAFKREFLKNSLISVTPFLGLNYANGRPDFTINGIRGEATRITLYSSIGTDINLNIQSEYYGIQPFVKFELRQGSERFEFDRTSSKIEYGLTDNPLNYGPVYGIRVINLLERAFFSVEYTPNSYTYDIPNQETYTFKKYAGGSIKLGFEI